MTDKAYAVPLHELLDSVPRDARLVIDDPDGKGTRFIPVGRYCHEAAEALRARLAQPEQAPTNNGRYLTGYKAQPEPEPVVWMYQDKSTHEVKFQKHMRDFVDHGATYEVPLYTAPPQRKWVGLTDEEIDQVAWPHFIGNILPSVKLIVRQLEAILKEKNHG